MSNNMNEYCCPKDCLNRKPGCHGSCEKHKRYQKEKEAIKEAKRKDNLKHQVIEKPYLAKSGIKRKVSRSNRCYGYCFYRHEKRGR